MGSTYLARAGGRGGIALCGMSPVNDPATPTELQAQLEDNRQRVDVDHYDITISELLRMAADGELLIAPVYQRHFCWKPEDESRLIESLFLGLPVPSIYVATKGLDVGSRGWAPAAVGSDAFCR